MPNVDYGEKFIPAQSALFAPKPPVKLTGDLPPFHFLILNFLLLFLLGIYRESFFPFSIINTQDEIKSR